MINIFKVLKENEQLTQRNNTLENENEVLNKKVIKILTDKFDETESTKRVMAQNKKLRLQIKELKRIINEKGNKK